MTTKKERLYDAIERHGKQLLAIFPKATEQDPVKLCKRLRRLESTAQAIGLQLCNGPEMSEGEQDRRVEAVLAQLGKLLQFQAAGVACFVNLDPRGYALKIQDEDMRRLNLKLHSDWGGYGIIAPDLSENA